MFEDLFGNKIKELLVACPLDKMTTEGTLFWSGAKKPPTPLVFDASDDLHMEYILALASLRAHVYRITILPEQTALSYLARVCETARLPVFTVSSSTVATVATTDEEAKQQKQQQFSMIDIDSEFRNKLRLFYSFIAEFVIYFECHTSNYY